MAKVFVVTSGEYSDYGINRVFSTEALAQEWLKDSEGARWTDYHIEEYELDDLSAPPTFYWRIQLDPKTGNLVEASPQVSEDTNREDYERGKFWDTWQHHQVFHVHVYTRDKDRAIKVAGERLFAAQAQQLEKEDG